MEELANLKVDDDEGALQSGPEDDEEEADAGSISRQLGEFLDNSGFEDKLFQFLEDETSNLKIAEDGEEQSLELYAAFQKFQTLFDGEMTGFMEAAGVASSEELFQRMEEETNKSERATKFFSQLMASMEYDSFCNLARQFQSAAEWEDSEESDDPDD